MAILDRLLPAWRHSDPLVRAAAVRDLDEDGREIVASLARRDDDPRVRREAVKKLDQPELLLEISRTDANEEIRGLAAARAAELLVARAISSRPVDECLAALALLDRSSHRAAVAAQAAHPEIRRAALAQVGEETALAEVARRSDDPAVGLDAVGRIADAALLRRIAAGNAPCDVAIAALERIEDPDVLHALTQDRQVQKLVRKRARALLAQVVDDAHPLRAAERHAQRLRLIGEIEGFTEADDPVAATAALRAARAQWQELDAHGAAEADDDERFRRVCDALSARIARAERRSATEEQREHAHQHQHSERQRLCAEIESLTGPETPTKLELAQTAWAALGPVDDPQSFELAARFALAVERCELHHQKWSARHEFQMQLEALVRDAEALVESGDPRAAARPRAALETRWDELAASPAGTKWFVEERALQRRFTAAGEALQERRTALVTNREQNEREARAHLTALCARLEKQVRSERVKPATADRALEAIAAASPRLRDLPALERAGLRQRLDDAQQALVRRAAQQETAEEWKRWANTDAQKQLIERAEALLAAGDPERMLQECVEIDRDWKRFGVVPQEHSQVLWERFRAVRGELHRQTSAYLADNLTKKEALCAEAERLTDSTDWLATAATFQRLQAEWKEIGSVRARLAAALLERFRAPANAFFTRRKADLSVRRERRQESVAQMRALCEAAAAVADSDDWEVAEAEIRRLQSEWRRVAPRGDKAATHWDEFKGTCDRFFERYRRRDEIAAEARFAQAEAIVTGLESMQGSIGAPEGPTPEDIARSLNEALAQWGRLGAGSSATAQQLGERLQAACAAIETACLEDLEAVGLDVDNAVRQREKFCARLERAIESLAATAEEPPAIDLGERLRLALAANTIGGSAALPHERALHEAIEAGERVEEKWESLGPVVGRRARDLVERFAKARAQFAELRRARAGEQRSGG